MKSRGEAFALLGNSVTSSLLLTKVNRLTLKDLELGPTNRQLVTSASSCAQGELRYPNDAHWPHKTACLASLL